MMYNYKILFVFLVMFAVGTIGHRKPNCDYCEQHCTNPQINRGFTPTTITRPTTRVTFTKTEKESPTPNFSCNGKRNRELTKAANDEQLQINQLIHQIRFESVLLNVFSDVIQTATGFVTGLFDTSKNAVKTFFTLSHYRLVGEVKGDEADFRIQGRSKTYSHVVIRLDKVFGVTKIQEAFTKSCQCGETVYLD